MQRLEVVPCMGTTSLEGKDHQYHPLITNKLQCSVGKIENAQKSLRKEIIFKDLLLLG